MNMKKRENDGETGFGLLRVKQISYIFIDAEV